jgi:lysozyme
MALLNAVIDISHYQIVTNFHQIKSDGILAVFQKATQGLSIVDPTYLTHRRDAVSAGLLFGSYHFATDADPVQQADFYLNIADDKDCMVLDFEPNIRATMSLAQAEDFVGHIYLKTGKYPGLYSGESFLNAQLGNNTSTVLKNCFLWIAKFSTITPKIPPAFPTFSFWQYTDGVAGPAPHGVNGIMGGRCDRDYFNGSATNLAKFFA